MKYYLIAGEPSGDALAARLMEALRRKDKKAEFYGVGGDSMQAQGLKTLFDISDLAVMGLAEVIPSIPKILRHIENTVTDIQNIKPDAVITVDSWSFSARIHKKLRKLKLGIPQIHYVAPQVWAWKKKRARTMYKYIDLLLTLFPNEPRYFTCYHLDAQFVGHPVIESMIVNGGDKKGLFRKEHHIKKDDTLMLILPGSRHNEVERLLPEFLKVAQKVKEQHENVTFVIPTVSTVAKRVRNTVETVELPIIIVEGEKERRNAFHDADVAIAASGTVALELAIVGVPHIIAYKVPKLTEWVARHFIHIQYVNLSNILLGQEIVPELLQEDCNCDYILSFVNKFLAKQQPYSRQMEGFAKVRKLLGLGEQTPSDNAALAILNLVKKCHGKNLV